MELLSYLSLGLMAILGIAGSLLPSITNLALISIPINEAKIDLQSSLEITVTKDKIIEAEKGLLDHMKTKHSAVRDAIRNEKQISAENEAKLNEIISSYISTNY